METRNRILDKSQELFYKHGIRTVRVDDISAELGISKKTLYQYFDNKDSLVSTLTAGILTEHERSFDHICESAKNAVEEIIKMMDYMRHMFSTINPNMFYDLQKNHPNAWKKFLKFKENYVLTCVENNLNRGINEGFYRKNLKIKILSRMRVELVDIAFNPAVFPPLKFKIEEIHLTLLEHFLYGIVSLKGHKLIDKYLNYENEG